MMKTKNYLAFVTIALLISCKDETETLPVIPTPDTSTTVHGQTVIKVMPYPTGWIAVKETLQPQYLITTSKRDISWLASDFQKTSGYQPPQDWYLIDAVVHPSGDVSTAIINIDLKRNSFLAIKIVRINTGGSVVESEIHPLPLSREQTNYFPGSLDRIRLESYGEDVFVVARWNYNQVEASRFSFYKDQFKLQWQTLVEPDAFAGTLGIIGGGFDNFHQGDQSFFVYSAIDAHGNFYVGVASHEDILTNHDKEFNENLSAGADPGSYDFGVAIVTKLSPDGHRKYSNLMGTSNSKRLINMRVGNESIFLIGRVKTGGQLNSWDAWILAADASAGIVKSEFQVDIKDGDIFWDLTPLSDGRIIAVGTTAYTQNPSGLSVSDARTATAILLNASGNKVSEIELPQGPVNRGSEAMYVRSLRDGGIVVAGAHNAPGTHAEVYADGFIAIRHLSAVK
ncbi:MAG: hypothetical protein ABI477_19365 [Chryseolinea sp.]